MKRTHRLRALGDVASVMRASSSVAEAARRLGVDRSSVTRWIAAGKVPRPGGRRGVADLPAAAIVDGDSFVAWVDEMYDLSPTERVIAEHAGLALNAARSAALSPTLRLASMREFRAAVRDLKLEVPINGSPEAKA